MRKQESYWAFKASDTPEFGDLPHGAFAGTEAGWSSLSPGFRREIYRSSMKKLEFSVEAAIEEDTKRLARADMKYEQGVKSILARESF